MFDLLTKAIGDLIKKKAGLVVSFDRPAEDHAKPGTGTTVNAFLFDVREETTLRSNELSFERSNGKVTVERAPFFVTCSYLITVWVADTDADLQTQQKHLGQLMGILASQFEIPVPYTDVKADLKKSVRVPARLSSVDEKGGLSEFWSALGIKIRPSFVLKATVALHPSYPDEPIPEAKSLSLGIGVDKEPHTIWDRPEVIAEKLQTGLDRWHVIGGRVTDKNGEPQHVRVTIDQLNRQTETDPNGKYVFSSVPEGDYTISVSKISSGAPIASCDAKLHTPPRPPVTAAAPLRPEDKQSYDFPAIPTQK
jgi:Pvc16 N-terminal domain/Carboxypeptidase regulatory-like domain